MPIAAGDKLGHYEILSLLGKGGMGEVYRGRDTKLKRDVAIKVLPETFARDAERMARFQREAEMLASLNHSNIAAIYGVEERALVMELAEGTSPKGPLPFDDAWKIASQIASALEYAHDMGIIHRDLKPANIMVTPEGVVKLLDFGLAKAFTNRRETSASDSPENSPTLTIGATEVGVILGTAAYMPPEQAKGKAVDKRADIWSFGVVFYELLTGERLFNGEDVSDTLAQVLTKEPDLAKVPPKARKLLSRCLEKDPKKRLRDIGEAAYLLDEARVTAPAASRHTSWLPWCVAAFLLLALMPANILHFREQPPQTLLSARFQLDPPERFTGTFQLSPDGRYLAMVAQRKLWIRPLGSLEAKAVDGVEDPSYPFWSPDSASIGFFAQGKVKKVALDGGVVQTLCDAPEGRGAAWNADGIIVFAGLRGGLQRVSAAGGAVTFVTKLPGISSNQGGDTHRYPVFLPDGRHFLFVYLAGKPETAGIYAGSLNGGEPVRIAPDVSNPGYAPGPTANGGGYLLFVRERTLMAQPFNAGTLRITGEMFPVVQQMTATGNTANFAFSVSANGAMAYRIGEWRRNTELSWFDRTGKRLDAVSKALQLVAFTLAPDQMRLAVSLVAVEKGVLQTDIWRLETIQGTPSRFTYGPAPGWGIPVWSPDGNQLAYSTANFAGVGSYEIRRKRWNMAGKEELLLRSSSLVYSRDWSPDGKWLLYGVNGDLWLLPLEGDHKPIPFTQTPASNEDFGQFSPDGKWIAYVSNESGQDQVYVQPIPATAAKWQLSIAGGSYPRWRSDGKELFFIASDGKLMVVPIVSAGMRNVASNGVLEPGAPQVLFDIGDSYGFGNGFAWPYQPGADGQRFLIGLPPSGEKPPPITMVLNWQAGLKK